MKCPCCAGTGEIERDIITTSDNTIYLTRIEQKIYNAVSEYREISVDKLIQEVYNTHPPAYPKNTLTTLIWKLNVKLKVLGVRIGTGSKGGARGRHAPYRFIPLEVSHVDSSSERS